MNVDESLLKSGLKYQKASSSKLLALLAVIFFSLLSVVSTGIVSEHLFKIPNQIKILDTEYENAKESGPIEHIQTLPVVLGQNDIVCDYAEAPYIRIPVEEINYYQTDRGLPGFKGYNGNAIRFLSTPCSENYELKRFALHADESISSSIVWAIVGYVSSLISLYVLMRPKKAHSPPYGSKLDLYIAKVHPDIQKPVLTKTTVVESGLVFENAPAINWQDIRQFDFSTVFGATALSLIFNDDTQYILISRDFADLQKTYNLRKTSALAPKAVATGASVLAVMKDVKNDKAISALVNALRFNRVKSSLAVTSMTDFLLFYVVGYAALLSPFVAFGLLYAEQSGRTAMGILIGLVPIFALVISGMVYAQKRDRQSFKLAKLLE